MDTKYEKPRHGIDSGVYLLDGVRPVLIAGEDYVAVQKGKNPELNRDLASRLTRVKEDDPLLDDPDVCTWLTSQANHGGSSVKTVIDMFYETGEFKVPTDIVN